MGLTRRRILHEIEVIYLVVLGDIFVQTTNIEIKNDKITL